MFAKKRKKNPFRISQNKTERQRIVVTSTNEAHL